jgi:two-component sensor histidine kinase
MTLLQPLGLAVSDVFITEELKARAPKKTDYLREKEALQELAARMAVAPEEVLPRFVDLAMEMTGGVSAGISLYEGDDTRVFRWRYLRGVLSHFDEATTPRDNSPCGTTLDQNAPVLARHPERIYDWISDANIVVPEVLLVPLYIAGTEPLGTLWIVAPEKGHFDSGHARAVTELATFVGAALSILNTQKQLRQALEEQQRLAAEMDHRVKNLFTVADAMVRTTARTTSTKEEMEQTLTGRLHALATAHSLVRRKAGVAGGVTTLAEVIEALMRPHASGLRPRYTVQGPAVSCNEKAIDSLALVIHELATNATKYGGLATETGHVDIGWALDDNQLTIRWMERDGPPLAGEPSGKGYGSKLVHATVTRYFGGTIKYDWERSGLGVTIAVPASSLAN